MREITIVDLQKRKERYLLANLSIPSTTHSYSMCVEYMKKWFLDKFDKDFFKTVYVDGRHVFDDFTRFNSTEKLKREKPAVAIVPTIDLEYNNDHIDSNMLGADMFIKRSKWEEAFFKDKTNDSYLGLFFETLLMNYTFKIKVSTRAQQLDLYKAMSIKYRVNYTQGEYIDMDFHVPYSIVLQMAKDTGFDIVDDKVVDTISFLKYLNMHSSIPFLYKLRTVNGKKEFFIRLQQLYVHISVPSMSSDDGEREGQLQNNFMIEMQATVRFPAPKFYIYYSDTSNTYIEKFIGKESEEIYNGITYKINLPDLTKVNTKGWDYFLDTEFAIDGLDEILIIDFFDLFSKGTPIRRVIDYNLSIALSPEMFMEIRIYNNGIEITDFKMDWSTMTYTCNQTIENTVSFIVIYINNTYVNELLIEWEDMKKDRLK